MSHGPTHPPPHVFLVPELHPGNALVWWAVSRFTPVQVYRVHPACRWLLGHRLAILDQERYFSSDTLHCFRAEALQRWEGLLRHCPHKRWTMRMGSRHLDVTQKVLQDLAPFFERFVMLREIQRQIGLERAVLIGTWEWRHLTMLDRASFGWSPTESALSWVNILGDWGWGVLVSLAQGASSLTGLLRGVLRRRSSPPPRRITCVWDAVNPNELALEAEKRRFCWVVDERLIAAGDVLFLLPARLPRVVRQALEHANYRVACSVTDGYRWIPRWRLGLAAARLSWTMARTIMTDGVGVEGLAKVRYAAKLMQLAPIIDTLHPASYVTTTSRLGLEHPVIAYCHAVGIRTVMYSYSTNSHAFSATPCRCDFRTLDFAHVLSSHVVVWNDDAKRYLGQLPQGQHLSIEVLGPLMPGDERAISQDRRLLRAVYGRTNADAHADAKWVAAFDVSTAPKRFRIGRGLYTWHPNAYTEEYNHAFLRDLLRLLTEGDDLVVAFKPKRDPFGSKFLYPAETRQLLERLARHPRGVILPHDLNPWIPIALADVTVAVPFASPVLGGWHYRIPGIFHDPLNVCRWHRYAALEGAITHSYEELKAKVQELLFAEAASPSARDGHWRPVAEFVGPHPGEDASDAFRRFLRGVSEQTVNRGKMERSPTAVMHEVSP